MERPLKAPARAQRTPARDGFEIAQASRRLGLTKVQLAASLNVTIQTLQNRENGQDTKRMSSKTRDLRELLSRMDEYVVALNQKEWLSLDQIQFPSWTRLHPDGRTIPGMQAANP